MPKARAMFAASVCCTDDFEALSKDARLLYFQLAFEADTVGEIFRARRIAEVCGFDGSAIEALLSGGYLLEIGNRVFIRHYFVSNSLANKNQRRTAEKMLAAVGGLEFEGEEFASPYRAVGYRSATCSLQIGANNNELNKSSLKKEKEKAAGKPAVNGAGFPAGQIVAACPDCGGNLLKTNSKQPGTNRRIYRCDSCGYEETREGE